MTVLLECKNITKEYGDAVILDKVNLSIKFGEKIALVGTNGTGKTTLANIIYGSEEAEGSIKWFKNNIRIGYMKQATDYIEGYNTLSGGEKTKKLLKEVLYGNYDMLILDEPTNHIDLHVREQLEEVLQEYNGTIILVTHDRYMLKKVCDKLLVFKDKKIFRYEGGIDEYINKNQEKKKESSKEEIMILENKISSTLGKLCLVAAGSKEYVELDLEYKELIKKLNECK